MVSSKGRKYITEISARGDCYGGEGGVLDLLNWCGKAGIVDVTDEEAGFYYNHPKLSYSDYVASHPQSSKQR